MIPPRYLPEAGSRGPGGDRIEHPVVRREIARAQRIIEGQNFEIRRTLARYASTLEEQYALVMQRRAALVSGDEVPDVWARAPVARARLVAAVGEAATDDAERAVTRAHLDRLWREHLAAGADLREGIHLVRLGGQDPLRKFVTELETGFARMSEALDEAVLSSLDRVRAAGGRIEIEGVDLKGPSSTWTYLVNDDPFREQVLLSLIGGGGRTMAVYASIVMPGLFLLWTVVQRFAKRPRRRQP